MLKPLRIIAAGAALTVLLALAGVAQSATPTQHAAVEAKAKAELAARLKVQADAKKRADGLAKSRIDMAAKAKSVTRSKQIVHTETKLRLEAARTAALAHARIMAAQGAQNGATKAKSGRRLVSRHVHGEATAPQASGLTKSR